MTYVTPADVTVSDDWQEHINRNSNEPGTDYETEYGTDCRMPGDGVIAYIDHSNGGGEGRRLQLNMDTGHVIDFIHASRINGYEGMRVSKNQKGIFFSGASGFGNDWYYGPHVHVTLRSRIGLPYSQTINFENYIDVPEPPIEIEDISEMRLVRNTDSEGGTVRFYTEFGYTLVQNIADRNLLARYIESKSPIQPDGNASVPQFLNLELDIINRYILETYPDFNIPISMSAINRVIKVLLLVGAIMAGLLLVRGITE